jgi:hypothetical protein
MKNQKIIKICEQKFIYLNYSPRTAENYLYHIKEFVKSVGRELKSELESETACLFKSFFVYLSIKIKGYDRRRITSIT